MTLYITVSRACLSIIGRKRNKQVSMLFCSYCSSAMNTYGYGLARSSRTFSWRRVSQQRNLSRKCCRALLPGRGSHHLDVDRVRTLSNQPLRSVRTVAGCSAGAQIERSMSNPAGLHDARRSDHSREAGISQAGSTDLTRLGHYQITPTRPNTGQSGELMGLTELGRSLSRSLSRRDHAAPEEATHRHVVVGKCSITTASYVCAIGSSCDDRSLDHRNLSYN